MGLGSYPAVSLKEAREQSDIHRALVRQGTDPIKQRAREQREAVRNLHVLKDIALDAFESRKAELKDDGKAGGWLSPLELHVLPKLGKVPSTAPRAMLATLSIVLNPFSLVLRSNGRPRDCGA